MTASDDRLLSPDFLGDLPSRPLDEIRAMRAADGSRVIVYTPQGASFTLDQSLVKAARTRQYWFDPRYGAEYEFGSSSVDWDGQTFQTFTPPTSGRGRDWVLVIEAVPGVPAAVTPTVN